MMTGTSDSGSPVTAVPITFMLQGAKHAIVSQGTGGHADTQEEARTSATVKSEKSDYMKSNTEN